MSNLRCEECGYPLGGLRDEARCPECARAVSASLPESRLGTPWQRGAGLFSWARTVYGVLARPGAMFGAVRMDDRSWRGLLALNLMAASFLLVDPWVGVFIGDPARGWYGSAPVVQLLVRGVMLGVETCAGALVLLALTWLVGAAMRVASMPAVNVRQVLAHASAGWIAAGLLSLLGMALHYSVHRFGGEWARVLMGRTVTLPGLVRGPVSVGIATGVGVVLLGYACGVAILASRVRTGVVRCRYAALLRR